MQNFTYKFSDIFLLSWSTGTSVIAEAATEDILEEKVLGLQLY